VLIQTLEALGAQVRWALVQYFSPHRITPAAAHRRQRPRRCFAVKGETLEEYWDYNPPHLRMERRRFFSKHDSSTTAVMPRLLLPPGHSSAETDISVLNNPGAERRSASCFAAIKAQTGEGSEVVFPCA